MQETTTFYPEKRSGLIFQVGLSLFFLALGGLGILMATQQDNGLFFIIWLIIALVFLPPAGLLIYRAYSLAQASYVIEREGLRLRWGLRAEDIPLGKIEWIRPADELGFGLRLPILKWQGALVGGHPTEGLGDVEYMASDLEHLLLVATQEKVYGISPLDTKNFLRQFQLTSEMGSLTEFQEYSVKPIVFMQKVWNDKLARIFIMAGLLLNFLLFIFTSIYIPTRPMASLGFDSLGHLMPASPSESLLLFPVLAGLGFIVDVAVGFIFYRRDDSQLIAYITWASTPVIPVLLLIVMVKLI